MSERISIHDKKNVLVKLKFYVVILRYFMLKNIEFRKGLDGCMDGLKTKVSVE